MFCASTYADTVGLTFTSDRQMMPDPDIMRECLDEAVAAVADTEKRANWPASNRRRKSAM